MGFRKRLLEWCQKPKKSDSQHFLARLAVRLHFPHVRMPQVSLSLGLISLFVSLPLTYAIMAFTLALLTGKCLDFTLYGAGQLAFLMDGYTNAILLYTPFFVPIGWVVTNSILSKMKKGGRKILVFSALLLIIAPVGFTFGLNNGFFDFIIISEVGTIDLSTGTATFKLSNIGLTDVKIAKVEIGNLVFNDPSDDWSGSHIGSILERGKQATMTINYLRNSDVTPTTFKEGKYPIIIYTDSIATARSEIEAEISEIMEIYCVQFRLKYSTEETIQGERYFSIGIELRLNFSRAVGSIYSVTIGNVTLKSDYPIRIDGNYEYKYTLMMNQEPLTPLEISLDSHPGTSHFRAETRGGGRYDIYSTQPLTPEMFKIGEAYSITVRTMTNNNYTSLVTLTE
jgi:hypothetical protein